MTKQRDNYAEFIAKKKNITSEQAHQEAAEVARRVDRKNKGKGDE